MAPGYILEHYCVQPEAVLAHTSAVIIAETLLQGI